MGLLDSIEKLINEHGSAVILKERIVLANDQYAALEKKVTTLQSEKAALESKAAALQKENERLHLNLRKAEEQIQDLERQLSVHHGRYLDETATQILLLIADHADCTTETRARHLGLHSEKILYYRDELVRWTYLDYGLTGLDQEYYQLTQPGRKFLIDHGLL